MEEKLLDPTLLGVIIGSILSLFGNVITQFFASRKEERLWERQRKIAKDDRDEKATREEMIEIRELYHKCLLVLSVYLSTNNANSNEDENKQEEILQEIHHWLSLLLLRNPSKKLTKLLREFTDKPSIYDAEDIRNYVVELASQENSLFSSESNVIEESADKKEASSERTIQIQIKNSFRRSELIKGIEIPTHHKESYELKELTNGQREKLAKLFFNAYGHIPNSVRLYLPIHSKGAKQISYQGKIWEAELNPAESSLQDILKQWEQDFEIFEKSAIESLNVN